MAQHNANLIPVILLKLLFIECSVLKIIKTMLEYKTYDF